MSDRVVAIDAGGRVRTRLQQLYEAKGYRVQAIPMAAPGTSGEVPWAAPDRLVHAIVFEYPQQHGRGGELLRAALEWRPRPALLALCPQGMLEAALLALKEGADDFLLAPFDPDELEIKLDRALERQRERTELELLRARQPRTPARRILGSSAAMRQVRRQVERVASARSPVLITGEKGAGRALVAAAIHEASPRCDRPFVRVHCAALPERLLEAELFGHEPGAFTGADRRRRGCFEAAEGGTLFLDEIGETQLRTQAKLLRVLQDGECERLGRTGPIRVDVQLIAATSRDLALQIAEGSFREDLFFRLQRVSIELPPLRERPEDIAHLAEHFFSDFNDEMPMPTRKRGFAPEALVALEQHAWPGNVRELRNAIERAVLLGESAWIGVDDLALRGVEKRSASAGMRLLMPEQGVDYREIERAMLVEALERADWVQKRAAHLLRMSRRQLNYRIRRLGITHPSWRSNRPGAGHSAGAG